jgi:O-6-methylguanine DNA methyltransferase
VALCSNAIAANFLFHISAPACIVSAVQEVIQTADFESNFGTVRIASSERGLVYLGFPLNNGRGFSGFRERFAPGCITRNNVAVNQIFFEQAIEFVMGDRKEFEVPIDLRASPFQQKIFKIVSEIRSGETLSYKDVAQLSGDDRAVRAVGMALEANPLALVIPCHRVVGKGGKLQGYAGGVELKARLLAAEQTGPANGRLF